MESPDLSAGPAWLRIVDGEVEVRVRVVPRSSRDRIAGVLADRLKLQVTSPPVDGAANEAVIELMARSAGVPVRSVRINAGRAGRSKTVRLACQDAVRTAARLVALVEAIR